MESEDINPVQQKKHTVRNLFASAIALLVGGLVVFFSFFHTEPPVEQDITVPAVQNVESYQIVEKTVPDEYVSHSVKSAEKKPSIRYIEYIVKKDDMLSSISKNRYKSRYFWPLIYMHNKNIIKNQDALTPGMILQIPDTIDMQTEENIVLVAQSFIDAYKNYKEIGKTEKARWLIYSCYSYVNPKILDDYQNKIDTDDLDAVRKYIGRFTK